MIRFALLTAALACAVLCLACAGARQPAGTPPTKDKAAPDAPPAGERKIIRTVPIGGKDRPIEPMHVLALHASDVVAYKETYMGNWVETRATGALEIREDGGGYYVMESAGTLDGAGRPRFVRVGIREETARWMSEAGKKWHRVSDYDPYRLRVLVTGSPPVFSDGHIVEVGK